MALGLAFFLSKPMSAYQLGEAYARNMGVNISRFRVELILLSSVLSACVTAFGRSDLLCGNCSAAADEESSENGETDSGDSGLFPGRSSVLPLL